MEAIEIKSNPVSLETYFSKFRENTVGVNHSFKSTCMSTAYDFEIAIRDIYPGEQLTDSLRRDRTRRA